MKTPKNGRKMTKMSHRAFTPPPVSLRRKMSTMTLKTIISHMMKMKNTNIVQMMFSRGYSAAIGICTSLSGEGRGSLMVPTGPGASNGARIPDRGGVHRSEPACRLLLWGGFVAVVDGFLRIAL